MNERIYTLAEQAGAARWNDELNGNSIDFSPEQFKKFAELIVRECAEVMVNDPWLADVRSATRGCARSIKQHFGVEG